MPLTISFPCYFPASLAGKNTLRCQVYQPGSATPLAGLTVTSTEVPATRQALYMVTVAGLPDGLAGGTALVDFSDVPMRAAAENLTPLLQIALAKKHALLVGQGGEGSCAVSFELLRSGLPADNEIMTIKDAGGQFVAAIMTDDEGKAVFSLSPGSYMFIRNSKGTKHVQKRVVPNAASASFSSLASWS